MYNTQKPCQVHSESNQSAINDDITTTYFRHETRGCQKYGFRKEEHEKPLVG